MYNVHCIFCILVILKLYWRGLGVFICFGGAEGYGWAVLYILHQNRGSLRSGIGFTLSQKGFFKDVGHVSSNWRLPKDGVSSTPSDQVQTDIVEQKQLRASPIGLKRGAQFLFIDFCGTIPTYLSATLNVQIMGWTRTYWVHLGLSVRNMSNSID